MTTILMLILLALIKTLTDGHRRSDAISIRKKLLERTNELGMAVFLEPYPWYSRTHQAGGQSSIN